jgi:polysaccharide biosynthesis transport protein
MTQRSLSPLPPESSHPEVYQPAVHPNGPAGGEDPHWGAPHHGEEGFDWRKPVAALLRYKWVILLAVALGAGAAYLAWDRVEPEYVAQGSIWIQSEEGGDRGPIVTQGLLQARSWRDLLQSYTVLDEVVYQQKLYLHTSRPEDIELLDQFDLEDRFVPGSYRLRVSEDGTRVELSKDRVIVDRGSPGSVLGRDLGFALRVPEGRLSAGDEIDFTLVTPREASSRLREDLVTLMDERGNFIRLELRGRNPERTAATVNGIMERHVEVAADLKRGHLDEQTEILGRQLQQQEVELREAEQALEAFRVQTVTLPSEERMAIQPGLEMTRDPVFAEFFRMRMEQDERRRDIRRLEAVLDGLGGSGFPVEAVELVPAVMSSSQIQEALSALVLARTERRELLTRYTSEHPRVREVAEGIQVLESDRLPALLSELLTQLRQEESTLEQRIAASGTDLSEIPPRAIEEARLRRRVDIAETLYTDLRGRYETATLARASSSPEVRILDRAMPPQSPTNDQRVRLAGMAFMAFLGMGVAGALLLDRMDTRIRTPDEAVRAIGFGILGAVPRLRWTNGKKGTRNVNQVYEAFRELRTNLEYAYGSAGPMILTITSTAAEEGKTLVTTNLGIAFAGLGRRTLIIDGDTRRGDLHHYLEGRRKPGLTDYLRSSASPGDIVQGTAYQGLRFVGSGTHVSNSPELLGSPRMGRLMAGLRKDYDVIIVDSPPLGAGADAMVLGSLTGHLVMVVRSGSTDRDLTMAKLEPLHRLPVRVLGVVLNDFVPGRLSSYSKYYGSYLPDYEAGVEVDEDGVVAPTPEKRIAGATAE